MIKRIALIGTGNVAEQLCRILLEKDFELVGVYSRTKESRNAFGIKWNIEVCTSFTEIEEKKPDLILIAVNDSVINSVSHSLEQNSVVVHTSGSIPISELRQTSRGVFYPLQTFSKEKKVDWSEVPICVEGSTPELTEELMNLGKSISKEVNEIDSEQRKYLHVSAVFACNFSNHMYAIAHKLMEEHQMDFEMLKPLIRETAEKIDSLAPQKAQTGPASRKDEKTMNDHLELLAESDNLRHLYGLISEQIIALQDGKKL
jgi:predicted short-subunit dehydrogenase-like oxidoreductase (DUF2520 family)